MRSRRPCTEQQVRAFERAVRSCNDATLRTFFAAPANVCVALDVEYFLAHEYDDSTVVMWDEQRAELATELRHRGAWFDPRSGDGDVDTISIYNDDVVEWLTKTRAAPDDAPVISDLLPRTIEYLFHDLIVQSVEALDMGSLEMLLESPTFTTFLSDLDREWVLSTAMRYHGAEGARDVIHTLVAHGATVDGNHTGPSLPSLTSLGALRSLPSLVCLVENGAIVVGIQRELARAVRASSSSSAQTLAYVRELLRLGADVNAAEESALHIAVREKKHGVIHALVTKGFADIDARDSNGQTPLMRAVALSGRVGFGGPMAEIVPILQLLALGADVNAQDDEGRTALLLAPLSQSHQVFRELLARGADATIADRAGRTPLHCVGHSHHGVVELLRLLVERGADVNARTCDGRTPLYALLSDGLWQRSSALPEAVETLLRHGADPNLPDHTGVTPLRLCRQCQSGPDHELIQLLEASGALAE